MLLAICTLTACGDMPDPSQTGASPQSDMIMLTLHNGSTVSICDKTDQMIETEDGYQWNFRDGNCSLTFPKTWESRFIIRGTTVYCLACFERAEVCSSLFTIEFRSAEQVASDPYPAMILGLSGKEYVCAVYPHAGEPENEVLKREYQALSADCGAILKTAACADSVKFQPIDTEIYMPAESGVKSAIFGNWKMHTTKTGNLDEQICFRNDGTLTFTSNGNTIEGSCLFNIYAATYDWNDQNNWGEAALVFLNGGIYRATYYETDPFTLDFSPIQLPPDLSDPLNGTVFAIAP